MTAIQQPIKKAYFMDDRREAKRLDSKVNPDEFINDFLKAYIPDEQHFKVLDVGCGAGMIASTIARRYENVRVTGVDISKQRLAEARHKTIVFDNARFLEGSIYKVPLPDESMDLIYTRFLLEYLSDPVKAIKELNRVCKKGGIVVLQDLDAQLVSHYPYDLLHLQEVLDGLAETGFDPYIGRKLFTYGRLAGFNHVDTDIRPYHKVIGKIDEVNDGLWDLKLDIAMNKFSEILGEEKAIEFKDNFMKFLRDEDTMMYSNLFTVYLRKA